MTETECKARWKKPDLCPCGAELPYHLVGIDPIVVVNRTINTPLTHVCSCERKFQADGSDFVIIGVEANPFIHAGQPIHLGPQETLDFVRLMQSLADEGHGGAKELIGRIDLKRGSILGMAEWFADTDPRFDPSKGLGRIDVVEDGEVKGHVTGIKSMPSIDQDILGSTDTLYEFGSSVAAEAMAAHSRLEIAKIDNEARTVTAIEEPCDCDKFVGPHSHIDENTIVPWKAYVFSMTEFAEANRKRQEEVNRLEEQVLETEQVLEIAKRTVSHLPMRIQDQLDDDTKARLVSSNADDIFGLLEIIK